MTIREVITGIAPGTNVRVRVLGVHDFAGKTGARKTQALLERISSHNCNDAFVTTIYPLWHAHELYIECVPC